MALTKDEMERLLDEVNDIAAEALDGGKAADLREALEEIEGLTNSDNELDFTGDEITFTEAGADDEEEEAA